MRNLIRLAIIALAAISCSHGGRKESQPHTRFTIERMNKITPVKNQGKSDLCWVYAMLATIESDRLMQGDSVNLSPHYIARMTLRRELICSYTSGGRDSVALTAMSPRLLRMLELYGAIPYDSYHSECNYNVLCRRLNILVEQSIRRLSGIDTLLKMGDEIMDEHINPMPKKVFMYGAEYTSGEFARSVCKTRDYQALTSFTHQPFYKRIPINVPDNRTNETFYNIPIDSLMNRVIKTLEQGRSVCWEGDVTEHGFSFKQGVARLQTNETDLSQAARQRMFETFRTTDDHCMELIGLAHDEKGHRYFVCKNSWGTANPYNGLMFMSVDYARMKTIAVVMRTKD